MADEIHDEIGKIAERIPGCRYVSVVGYDGIPIAQYIVDAHCDVNAFDAEISSIMLASREVKDNLALSEERELIWLTEDSFFIVHPVGVDFFIYACLKAAGSNPGAARIALSKAKKRVHNLVYQEE